MIPETETRFYQKAVDTEIEFSGADAHGKATQLTRHQGAAVTTGTRIDEAELKRSADAAAAMAKRVKDQTPMPGSQAALRQMLEGWRLGQPDDSVMAPNLGAAVRRRYGAGPFSVVSGFSRTRKPSRSPASVSNRR